GQSCSGASKSCSTTSPPAPFASTRIFCSAWLNAFWHSRVSTTPRSNWRSDSSSGSSPCSSRATMASSSARAASKSGVACCFCRVTRSVRQAGWGRSLLHASKSGVRICLNPVVAAGLDEESSVNLKGSKTEGNLKAAFAGESQANRRYLYFAQKADVEGYNDVAA